MAKYNIGGYIFNDENSAKKAAKELKAVEYILGQMKTADEQEVLKIYKKIISQKLFSTQIGMGFLNQLRQNLVATGAFDEDQIPPIYAVEEQEAPKPQAPPKQNPPEKPAPAVKATVEKAEEQPKEEPAKEKRVKEKRAKKLTKLIKEKTDKKSTVDTEDSSGVIRKLRLVNSFLIVCVFTLLFCVLGMFIVSSTINSPTILNYKEAITDEYSSWKQQLDERERELNEREAELDAREAEVSGIEGN
ncbi:hypothetical protein SAMN05421493_101653 [Pseudobutyrivibrio sp. 49]|uniref:hypothetical protein n=1 Tax=Pseudobutyrivibrio sp. 49 TaxID=1855344 RepID=UPI00088F5A00|nr:hypothetical protein [Pseudobutyrivibrio sp. 49]SDH48313.1 hypothetical protein SAMN05421493_101653 [Pseudobutyrivibrio sp. 49]